MLYQQAAGLCRLYIRPWTRTRWKAGGIIEVWRLEAYRELWEVHAVWWDNLRKDFNRSKLAVSLVAGEWGMDDTGKELKLHVG